MGLDNALLKLINARSERGDLGDQTPAHGWMTWGDLKALCDKMSPEQLAHPFECQTPDSEDTGATIGLFGAININTQGYYCQSPETGNPLFKYRSVDDNQHHPERLVVLLDVCPFSEDGDSWYTLQEDLSLVGNKTGKIIKLL